MLLKGLVSENEIGNEVLVLLNQQLARQQLLRDLDLDMRAAHPARPCADVSFASPSTW